VGKRRRLLVLLAALVLSTGRVRPGLCPAARKLRRGTSTKHLSEDPITSDPFTPPSPAGRYRIPSEKGKSTLFPSGEKVRSLDVDLGGREVKIKIQSSTSAGRRSCARAPAQGDVPAGDVTAGGALHPGAELRRHRRRQADYLRTSTTPFVEAEAAAADLSAAAVNDAVVRVNRWRALGQDVHNLQAKVQEQAAAIAALERRRPP
jgi:hypothetical protein